MRTAIFALAALAACSQVNPIAMAQVMRTDPLTVDPAGIEVALSLPDGVAIMVGSALLSLSAQRGEEVRAGQFALLPSPSEPQLWRIDPARLTELRALQAEIRIWEETDPDATTGALSLSLGPCRTAEAIAPDATVSAAVRLQAGGPMLPLLPPTPPAELHPSLEPGELPHCG